MNTSNELRLNIIHDMKRIAYTINNLHAEICKLISDMDKITKEEHNEVGNRTHDNNGGVDNDGQ